ncbi:MAG: c-type cytochrome biogenesis protein CcmI [Flavobacteriia bacterium]|nr:MAG: c-type cytochrome biogenesis protein CcmI [Flavobacteriia bacterium]
MTQTFWIAATVLIIIALAFVLYPVLSHRTGARKQTDLKNQNLMAYRSRMKELDREYEAGILDNENYRQLKEELAGAIEMAFKEDSQVIIESFLDGTEVSVGVITHNGEVTVLPITEIVSENDFFDFEAKYMGKSQEITPARISTAQEANVRKLAEFIYRTLGLKGFTRSEFIFIGDVPHLLEVNTTPGLTEESLLPQQAGVAGISLKTLFDSAIEEALR